MREVERLITEFDRSPRPKEFYDLGAIAEVLALCASLASAQPLRARVSVAALAWLRAGLFEDALFAKVEHLYHTTLLCYLASGVPAYRTADAAHAGQLLTSGLVGRSELPVLTMQIVATYVGACGIDFDLDALGSRDLRLVVDKRVLRARSDEYDILTLMMVAQLASLSDRFSHSLPQIFPQALLVQAIRSGHLNWIPILTLLCTTVYGIPPWLRRGATDAMRRSLEQATELLPAPEPGSWENDYVTRAEHGLRVRSSIASFALLA